ncbi:hypothetical protein HMPREF9606_00317 [Cutibacterium acnes HL036PA3]|nr:hypothetical protein HMPREF9606_00317 [Cutibacterium acnes HL036PA3]
MQIGLSWVAHRRAPSRRHGDIGTRVTRRPGTGPDRLDLHTPCHSSRWNDIVAA